MSEFRELVTRSRSIRRFDEQFEVGPEVLSELVELACYTPSAANRQPLRYFAVTGVRGAEKVFPSLGWAGYLKDWPGPGPGERPTAFLVMLCLKADALGASCDSGIAAQTIMLGAAEKGLGGCIVGAFDGDRLASALDIPDPWTVLLVIALGKPVETVVIDLIEEGGDIRYWRDQYAVHHVPKRKVDDVLVTDAKQLRGR
ncbi:MAG: nitroreductase family protein [Chlorobiaceae bacterium]|nr:nitroreductase family protein [Chlorobiaceae bacterium]